MLVLTSELLFFLVEVNSLLNSAVCGRLERGCWAAQTVFLVMIACAAFSFRVPMERNLRSIYPGSRLYLRPSLLAFAGWTYRTPRVPPVGAAIEPVSCHAAIATCLAGLRKPDGTLAQDCKQSSGSGTNLPAPVVTFRGSRGLQVMART